MLEIIIKFILEIMGLQLEASQYTVLPPNTHVRPSVEATMPLEAPKLPQVASLPQELSEYTFDYEIEQEKRFLKGLKIMLSNYDIYNQKMKCRVCRETECVCYDAGVVETSEFDKKIDTLFE